MSTALPAQVAEMINADALTPHNDLIDDIGRDKFAEAAISEGTMDGNNYSVPLYRHCPCDVDQEGPAGEKRSGGSKDLGRALRHSQGPYKGRCLWTVLPMRDK